MKPSTHSNAEPSCGETVGLHVLIKKQKKQDAIHISWGCSSLFDSFKNIKRTFLFPSNLIFYPMQFSKAVLTKHSDLVIAIQPYSATS